jgi:hypothetical protein
VRLALDVARREKDFARAEANAEARAKRTRRALETGNNNVLGAIEQVGEMGYHGINRLQGGQYRAAITASEHRQSLLEVHAEVRAGNVVLCFHSAKLLRRQLNFLSVTLYNYYLQAKRCSHEQENREALKRMENCMVRMEQREGTYITTATTTISTVIFTTSTTTSVTFIISTINTTTQRAARSRGLWASSRSRTPR